MRISVRQRTRWMQGHYWVLWHYGRPALKSFFTTGRLQYLDLFLYLLAPAKACLGVVVMLSGMAFTLVNNMVLYPRRTCRTRWWTGRCSSGCRSSR